MEQEKKKPKPHCSNTWRPMLQKYIKFFWFMHLNFQTLPVVSHSNCSSCLKKCMFKDSAFIWILPQMVFTKIFTDFNVFSVNTKKTAQYHVDVLTLSYSHCILPLWVLDFWSYRALWNTMTYNTWQYLDCCLVLGGTRPCKSKGFLPVSHSYNNFLIMQ